MQQIPRRMLIHNIILRPVLNKDEYGNRTFSASAAISYVRCEPSKRNALASLGEMKDDKLILFYDCFNSEPQTLTFNLNDEVEFNSQKYTIRDFKDFSPHHLEIFLK